MVNLSLFLDSHLIVAMLEMVKAATESLNGHLAVEPQMPEDDEDLQMAWQADLIEALHYDIDYLLMVLRDHDFGKGELIMEEGVAESVVRACSAIRLKLRESALRKLTDHQLESAEVDILSLPTDTQQCYACYLFLASLQSLILIELDPSCEEF